MTTATYAPSVTIPRTAPRRYVNPKGYVRQSEEQYAAQLRGEVAIEREAEAIQRIAETVEAGSLVAGEVMAGLLEENVLLRIVAGTRIATLEAEIRQLWDTVAALETELEQEREAHLTTLLVNSP